MTQLPALLADRDAYLERLRLIVPREVTGSGATDSRVAAAAALTLMYVGAIAGSRPIRPLAVIRMSDEMAARRIEDDRMAYYAATVSPAPGRNIDALCDRWGISRASWYQPNSREGLRDETFRRWEQNSVLRKDPMVSTTSGRPRYTLTGEFAALLDPALTGSALEAAVRLWQAKHLTPTGKARAVALTATGQAGAGIEVVLPNGKTRTLKPGGSSEILRGFITSALPTLLSQPQVVFISESGEPVNVVDDQLLAMLGLNLKVLKLLPDCLAMDLDPARDELWFVEVVESDGPIDEQRRAALLAWATDAGMTETQCRFITCFRSRTAGPAKSRLPLLARNSLAWYLDEPDALLDWRDLA